MKALQNVSVPPHPPTHPTLPPPTPSNCPCQDVARLIMAALRTDAAVGRTLPLAGPKAWTNDEVIALCEELADCDAEVSTA